MFKYAEIRSSKYGSISNEINIPKIKRFFIEVYILVPKPVFNTMIFKMNRKTKTMKYRRMNMITDPKFINEL